MIRLIVSIGCIALFASCSGGLLRFSDGVEQAPAVSVVVAHLASSYVNCMGSEGDARLAGTIRVNERWVETDKVAAIVKQTSASVKSQRCMLQALKKMEEEQRRNPLKEALGVGEYSVSGELKYPLLIHVSKVGNPLITFDVKAERRD